MTSTDYDRYLLDQADQANAPAHPEHAAQVSAYAWTAGLTREEWGWVHAIADERDELAYQQGVL